MSATGAPVEIDPSDVLDRYRYTCPRGHTSWERTADHFWCPQCWRAWDLDPVFYELTDRKHREQVPRDRVRFVG